MRHLPLILILGVASLFAGAALARASDPPGSPVRDPIPVILDAPADREALWNRLARPDFVILDGDEYRGLRERLGLSGPGAARPARVVSVAVSGKVDGDWAHLAVEQVVDVDRDEPGWVAVRLDGLLLSRASEAGRDLPVRLGEDRAWQVEVSGRGEHRIALAGLAPVRGSADLRRLDLATPPAASMRLDLEVPRAVRSASTGPNEPIDLPAEPAAPARLVASLSPRSRIDLSWREKADPSAAPAGLATARGDITLEFERGLMRARSTWTVAAVRGVIDRLVVRGSAFDEVAEVEVDGRPVPHESRVEGTKLVIAIPLAEPIRPEQPRQVRIATRRVISSSGPARVPFPGFAFDDARVQTGTLTIARLGPIHPAATPGRGIRAVDLRPEPAGETPGRPAAVALFEFSAQPFELPVQVDPEPTILRAEARTNVILGPTSAQVFTRLDFRAVQGRAAEVAVVLPRGLRFDSAGPPDVVESTRIAPLEAAPADAAPDASDRVATLTLTRAARDAGSFGVDLKGQAPIDPSGVVLLPLFRPRDVSDGGGVLALRGRRDLAFDLAPGPDGSPPAFRPEWGPPAEGWGNLPGVDLGLTAPAWFRQDPGAVAMPLRVAPLPVAYHHQSSVEVAVDRAGADVVDLVEGTVDSGLLDQVEVRVPSSVPARWEIDGTDVADHDPIERRPDGSRTIRVRFARGQAGAFRLRFRYRLRFPEPVAPGAEPVAEVALIEPTAGASLGDRIAARGEPGLDLAVRAPGWKAPSDAGTEAVRLLRPPGPGAGADTEPVRIAVRPVPTTALPASIASRVWLRTVQRPDGDLETTARFHLETRSGSIAVALPALSRWTRAEVDGNPVGSGVEVLGPDRYRVRLPGDPAPEQCVVRLDYVVPAASARGPLIPPRLLDGVLVQQTLWEVQVLGTRVGVGVPPGWSDENEWYRDGIILKRRPWRGAADLSAWVAGTAGPGSAAEAAPLLDYGRHGYLFSRVGPAAAMAFRLESRFMLVGLCSGPILLVGLLILGRRPPPRPLLAGVLVALFVAGTFGDVSVIVLIVQSSLLGFALLLAAVAMQGVLGRRAAAESRSSDHRVGPPAPAPPSAQPAAFLADGSTAIRPQPAPPAASTTGHPPGAGGGGPAPPPAPSTATLAQP